MSALRPILHAIGVTLWCLLPCSGAVQADEKAVDLAEERAARENAVPTASQVSDFDDLQLFAQHLATTTYVPEPPLIPALAELSYEQYRDIRFRNGRALWSDGDHPFWLEFFHRGFVQRDRVDVNVIEGNATKNELRTRQIPYDRELFDFEGAAAGVNIREPIGFAGFKAVGRFEEGGFGQEMLTFIGSSYFRARTGQTVYGTSARGLAVDVGMNRDEEFPDFRAFWVYEPAPGDRQLRVLALLDSPSLTGAYQFDFDPSMTVSKMRVTATLYFRELPGKLAIAPLTSMWIWGDGLAPPPLDKRPSCHDADGLLIHADENWTWRAFARLPYPSVTATRVEKLSGFGLLQRDRNFDHYGDTGARYDERPSVWVEPIESFGSGRIELMEIPGAHEGIDNIGAYFVADAEIDVDQPLELRYDVFFFGSTTTLAERVQPTCDNGDLLATCESFEVSRDDEAITLKIHFQPHEESVGDDDQDVVESGGQAPLGGWGRVDPGRVVPEISTVRGEVDDVVVLTNGSGYLVEVRLVPTEDAPVQVAFRLNDSTGVSLTESFEYLCPHEQPKFVYPAVYTRQE
ncbi:glucan biosynthesis protein [Allorhodopirellula heiligendammensis]|uniref:Glucans biosynthesis protein G n=1 Tax=Allorhodopirellula heiligendammensis TaxID=2714739 RepID=A0A5C6C4E8_9BACT|nr:glucan biosynthesis protein [Allorhodopirellula heiligendammensis]TWU18962.1 Glucans biosynthesis protein G precursor [Allorhodopirellula heiligendammensis]